MDVGPLDEGAMTAAYAARPALGKLEGLAVWLAGIQGAAPPKPLARRRFVVFGDEAPLLAAEWGVPVETVAYEEGPTTRERVMAAYDEGAARAGAAADEGVDVLLTAAPGRSVVPALIACALVDAEPVEVVARGDDAAWMRDVAMVRDALRRSGFRGLDGYGVLAELGGERLAAQAGFVTAAARRRTPVVADGAYALAAVAVANTLAPGTVAYVLVAQRHADPAFAALAAGLGVDPLLDLGVTGAGPAALLALPVLDAAVAVARS